jgi:hypothetical protein
MTRIFIEDQELDITKDFSQQITYAVDDLTNTDSKATSFSKTIVLPGTANNNRLLGNIFEFSNSNFTADTAQNVGYNFNASKSARARLEINGLQVMKGVLRLLEIIVDGEWIEYEVALFGELGGFYSSMAARKLTDLDFSEYDHQYNVTNITNSWNSPSGGTGYYYPLIDYGNTSPSNNIDFQKKNFYFTAFRPAFYVRQYMSKIIEQAGYTYTSTFFDSAFFKRLIIPNNQNRLQYKSVVQFAGNPFRSIATVGAEIGVEMKNVQSSNFSTSDDIVYKYDPATPVEVSILFGFSGTFRVSAPTDTQGTYGEAYASIQVIKNSSEIVWESERIGGQVTAWGINTARSFTYSIGTRGNSVTLSFAQDETFEIKLVSAGTVGPADPVLELSISETGSSFTVFNSGEKFIPALYNDYIFVNGTLPTNILQKDFFSSILKMFNLMVTEDKYIEKNLVIEPYVDFYNTDRTTYLDWSDKVDRSKPIKIKPMSEVNARYYQFKFKQDSDYLNEEYRKKYNEGFGDRIFDNNLEFTKDTDTTEVIFSTSPLIGYPDNDKVFPAIYKFNNSVEQMTEHNIRIMQAKKYTGRTGWRIMSSTGTYLSSSLTSYGYAGHFNDWENPTSDLNFGAPKELKFDLDAQYPSANLFNAYYSPYFAEITDKDSRLVTCKMKLNEKDIFNLDFGRFIWIDGVLYRLIKIVDYSADDTCEVQLLRAINTTY